MNIYRYYLNLAIAGLVAITGGCSSSPSVITSLEDLTTDSQKEGWVKIPQYRVVSVPGILPFAEVGDLHFYKTKRKPSSAIGLSNNNSYILESVIESQCDISCLADIRDNLLALRGTASKLIDERINLTRIRETQQPAEEENAATREAYNKKLDTAIASYRKIRDEMDTNHKEVLKSIKNSGILIYRWSTNTKKSGSVGTGGFVGASGKRNETYSGFALVSGLRIATLYVGNDLAKSWPELNKETSYKNRFELTTHVMQGRHILYVTEYDLESLIQAKLEASYKQLANLPETIKNLDTIEIEAALAKVSNLSNMGVLGGSKRRVIPVDWNKPNKTAIVAKLNGWQTFFVVKSDYMDLCELIGQGRCGTNQ